MKKEVKKELDEIKLIFGKLKPLKEQIGEEAYKLIERKIVGYLVYKGAFDLMCDQLVLRAKANRRPERKEKEDAGDS